MKIMNLPKLLKKKISLYWLLIPVVLVIILAGVLAFYYQKSSTDYKSLKNNFTVTSKERDELNTKLASISAELDLMKNDDQYLKNKKLQEEINNIHRVYLQAVTSYNNILDFRNVSTKTAKYDDFFALSLKYLADKNYASAEANLKKLDQQIKEETDKLTIAIKIPENVPLNNVAPGSGYQRQKVKIDEGEFLVSIIAADLNSTKVIVDTASDSTCSNDCPVLTLSDYVSRSGAFAGVNGSYFCPSTYPQCAGKTNTFDTLLMNKNKVYFNSDNNVYSVVPAVIFSGNSARFVTKSLEWGRDTSVDSVIANQPLLVFNGAVVFGGDGDAKHNNRGGRSFIGVTGNTVYIGVVHNATVVQSAKVLQALGVANALNLDDGGSTALWFGGYKAGPGRSIPNAVLFVKK